MLCADGIAGISNPGAHGFSEILYAFTSAANNNGSAFAGLSANTPFYNIMTAIAMWFGRFGVIVPVLAIAGSLAAKKRLAVNAGTLPTHGPLFVVLLIGTVVLVGALNYVPALALGPVIEQLEMRAFPPPPFSKNGLTEVLGLRPLQVDSAPPWGGPATGWAKGDRS